MVLIFGKSYTSKDRVSGGTADAHGSGPCTRKGVGVQIPSRAREKHRDPKKHAENLRTQRRFIRLP